MTESRVFLRKSETNELVESSLLDEVTDHHLAMWNGSWRPAMQAYCAGRVLRDKPEDHHWDWKWKANEWRYLLGYHSFAIVCENDLQGLMVASDFKSARLQAQFGKPIVYVEWRRDWTRTGHTSSVTANRMPDALENASPGAIAHQGRTVLSGCAPKKRSFGGGVRD